MGLQFRENSPYKSLEKRPNLLPPFELSKSTASRAHTLMWTAKELIRCHVTVHVSVCALLAVDLDNSKGGSRFGRFSKGHDVR